MKNKLFNVSMAMAILFIFTTNLSAQFGGGGGTPGLGGNGGGIGGSGGGPITPVVPLDGGMSLLFAASGIGYVAKKLRKN